jgi:hypothetical protein
MADDEAVKLIPKSLKCLREFYEGVEAARQAADAFEIY